MGDTMNTTIEAVISIFLAVVVLAGIALIVSQNSNSSSVISSATGGIANMLSVAISPVAGSATGSFNTSTGTPY